MEAQTLFANSRVNITAEGKRYLSAVIGSTYCDEYVKDLVKIGTTNLPFCQLLQKQTPQAAYLAFVSGFESKLNYVLKSIPTIRHLLLPLERAIRNKFIPIRYGGLAIPIFHEITEIKFMNSSKSTSELTALIKTVYSAI